jgi:uncharacterized protein (DUF4213/DUF364 family)
MSWSDSNDTGGVGAAVVSALLEQGRTTSVASVRIGLGYTAVSLADGRTGLAYTFRDDVERGCCAFNGIRPLAGRCAVELLHLLGSSDLLEAAVGLACANALGNQDRPSLGEGDVLDHFDLSRRDHVVMIGHFGPLVGPVRRRAGSLTVVERVNEAEGTLRPQREVAGLLAACDVALVTATSIINHTIDPLLEAASRCREVVVLGASTPLLPCVFEGHATLLSGVVVEDGPEVLRVVSEGGGMREFGPHVRKVNVRIGSSGPVQ